MVFLDAVYDLIESWICTLGFGVQPLFPELSSLFLLGVDEQGTALLSDSSSCSVVVFCLDKLQFSRRIKSADLHSANIEIHLNQMNDGRCFLVLGHFVSFHGNQDTIQIINCFNYRSVLFYNMVRPSRAIESSKTTLRFWQAR